MFDSSSFFVLLCFGVELKVNMRCSGTEEERGLRVLIRGGGGAVVVCGNTGERGL
jgi:hypothetical protein